MFGHLADDGKILVEVWQTENVWNAEIADDYGDIEAVRAQKNRYAIAPLDMLKAQKSARDRQLNIIGIYHSHPDHPAIPSECDRAWAWMGYSYIIVSLKQGKACDFRSWSLDDDHQFQPEEIITVD